MSTVKILERLIREFPRKNLKLSQVFALDAAENHLEEIRKKIKSEARLTDRGS